MSVFTEKNGVGNGVPTYFMQSRKFAATFSKLFFQARLLPGIQLIRAPTLRPPA